MRRIIQIAVSGGVEFSDTVVENPNIVYALCDDGTLWLRVIDLRKDDAKVPWRQLPPIPMPQKLDRLAE
jgi:hypothetical protein